MANRGHYTPQLLQDTGFLACKPAQVPMDPKVQLTATNSDLLPDFSQYRRLIGRLLYLILSRPDISFVVHKLSQFIAQPRTTHLQAVHHLLRYLKGKPRKGLFFSSSLHYSLELFRMLTGVPAQTLENLSLDFVFF